MSNLLLIDTDVLCYQFAYRHTREFSFDGETNVSCEREELALDDVEHFVNSIRETLKGDEIILVLSDRKENFRKHLDPTYKLNRNDKPKPNLWYAVRDFVEFGDHGYRVEWRPRLEGDDVLGIMATHPKYRDRAIIVSIDKDMKTIPGRLHLFNKPEQGVLHIDEEDAYRWLMYQVLWGDATDNYPGCPGLGEIKAADVIADAGAVENIWPRVLEEYAEWGLTRDDALHQARLAYILRSGDYKKGGTIKLWNPKKAVARLRL